MAEQDVVDAATSTAARAASDVAESYSPPAQSDAAPEPTAVDKMIDAMLPKLAERMAQPEPPPVPPKGFPLGFRIAAGTIAAMDPDAYQKIVGPALAGKQMEIEQYHRDVAGQKDDTQRAFMTLMGLAQRRDQQKELEANRSARLNIQEEVNRMRGEMNEARIGELEANRKQKEVDQKVAAEHVANISDRMSTIFPGIQQFAQTSAPDDPSGMVLMSEASALQNTLGEMAQSKEPVNPDAARQLQQEYNSIAQKFMMAALERKRLADQRAKSDATMAAGVAKRERIPAADGRQATNEANIIVGFADTLKYLNQNGPKIGNIKFSDFQRGPLGNKFRDTARAMYSTNIMAPRKEYFGAAYTATEGISGKWTFAQDINSMFIGELRTGLETLITMSARKHLDLLHGLEADGYDVEGRFDRYAKEIRPALKSVHAGFLDVPPGVPLGTQTMSLSTGGDLFIRLPGEKENRPWIPEDEMDYKWLARLMKWEGHRAGRIEENLSRLGAEPSAIAAIMSDIHMGGSSGQNR